MKKDYGEIKGYSSFPQWYQQRKAKLFFLTVVVFKFVIVRESSPGDCPCLLCGLWFSLYIGNENEN